MTRRLLAVAALFALVALAGCSAVFGPPATDEEALAENASYDWNTDANATLALEKSSYTAIYEVRNRSHFEVFHRDGLGQERSLAISALYFRYANGTKVSVDNSSLSATRGGGRTNVTLPGNVSGRLAFTAPRNGKAFAVPAHVTGSYDVTLPGGARVGVPVMAEVSPAGFSTSGPDDGRVTVHWDEVDARQVLVRWYLQRDLAIFSLLIAVLVVVGSGGSVFYYRRIKRLQARREEVGLDVDAEDDDPRDRGPPPGMR